MIVNDDNKLRIDIYLANITDMSRSKIKNLINDKKILVNGNSISANYKVRLNDKIDILEKEIDNIIEGEDIKINILYEDEYLAIINKESGMVVHPGAGNKNHTLVNALIYKYNFDTKDNIRPGIVHRLDKDTSGVMIIVKDEKLLDVISNMIKDKKVERKYIALVDGVIKNESGTIKAPIGRDPNNRLKYIVTDINAKDAVTHFKVLKRFNNKTLIECLLETGRTHQIRVHLKYINHPIFNDPLYNKEFINGFGQFLHSKSIKFIHPITKKELYIECDIPNIMKEYINKDIK